MQPTKRFGGMDIDPISGNAISAAQAKLETPAIGRSTTEYKFTKSGVIIYKDNFNLRLWEIAAAAFVGAAIYYVPDILKIWDIDVDLDLGKAFKEKRKEVPSKIFLEPIITRPSPVTEFYERPRKDIVMPWEEDFPWPWK